MNTESVSNEERKTIKLKEGKEEKRAEEDEEDKKVEKEQEEEEKTTLKEKEEEKVEGMEEIEGNYEKEISELDKQALSEKLQEAKKILKLFQEKEAMLKFISSSNPDSLLFETKKRGTISKATLAFISSLPLVSKILVLAVATPETVSELPKSLRDLAGKIRSAVWNRKKDTHDSGGDSEVEDCHSAVYDEVFEDTFTDVSPSKVPPSKKEKQKGKIEEEEKSVNEGKIELVPHKALESGLRLSDSTVLFISKKILTAHMKFKHIRWLSVCSSNLLAILDTVLALAELHLKGSPVTGELNLNTSENVFSSEDVITKACGFLYKCMKRIPNVSLIKNKSLIKNRLPEVREIKKAISQEDEGDLLFDRAAAFANFRFCDPNSFTFRGFLNFFAQAFEENQERPQILPTFLQKKESIMSLVRLAIDYSVLSQKIVYDWVIASMKFEDFAGTCLGEFNSMLNNLFKELQKKFEKNVTVLKSKTTTNLKEICSQLFGADLKLVGFYMNIVAHGILAVKEPSENHIKFGEELIQNDAITETVLILYELLDKLADIMPAQEFSRHSLVFYLITVISHHIYFYHVQKERKTQKPQSITDLDALDFPEARLSRYMSKEFDLGNLDVTPKLSKSYSEIRRTKLDGINIEHIFSHLSFKAKSAFQHIALLQHEYIQIERVLRELSKQRHWITSFKNKFDHMWYVRYSYNVFFNQFYFVG